MTDQSQPIDYGTDRRLIDWQPRLLAYITSLKVDRVKFDWNNFHCADFVGMAIEAQTGVNPWMPYAGQARSPEEAAQLVRDNGFTSMVEMLTKISGLPEIPVMQAQFGDVLFIPADPDDVECPPELDAGLAIAEPPYFWCMAPRGLSKGRQQKALRAYKVGFI